MAVMATELGIDMSRPMDEGDRRATRAFIDDMTQEWREVYDANYGKFENFTPEWRAVVEYLTGLSATVVEAQSALDAGLLPW